MEDTTRVTIIVGEHVLNLFMGIYLYVPVSSRMRNESSKNSDCH